MIINNTNPIRILSYKVRVRVCTVTHNQMKSHAWRNTRLMGLNELEPTIRSSCFAAHTCSLCMNTFKDVKVVHFLADTLYSLMTHKHVSMCTYVCMLVLYTHTHTVCRHTCVKRMSVCMLCPSNTCAESSLKGLASHSKATVHWPTQSDSALKDFSTPGMTSQTQNMRTFAMTRSHTIHIIYILYTYVHLYVHFTHCTCDLMVAGSCRGSPTNTTLEDP